MKGNDIAHRLLDLAVACLRLAATLEDTAVGKHIARQLIRSSTSGGANYEEARSPKAPPTSSTRSRSPGRRSARRRTG